MTTPALSNTTDGALLNSQRILADLLAPLPAREFAVRFWDGTVWELDTGLPATFTLVLSHPSSVRCMFWPHNDLTLPEAYVYGDIDVEGDMVAFLAFLRQLDSQYRSPALLMSLAWRLSRLPKTHRRPRQGIQAARLKGKLNSRQRDRAAIAFHYDVSNDFFGLFLDPRMVYTSSYFQTPDDTLAQAQEQKLDYICRKLRLAPGERFLDMGCGWGGLITYAAEHYGAIATGVTLSRAQAEFAQQEIDRRGLGERCHVEFADYRDFESSHLFDKIATVEVLEHTEEFMLPGYFRKVKKLLRPGGSLLLQAITLTGPKPVATWRKFITHYVFPDGRSRPVSTLAREGENAGLEVRDVESLREHYASTLKYWLSNLEEHHREAVAACDESTYRAFRLYLAGAAYGYIAAIYNVHQTLFVNPDRGKSGYPLTRHEWYSSKHGSSLANAPEMREVAIANS